MRNFWIIIALILILLGLGLYFSSHTMNDQGPQVVSSSTSSSIIASTTKNHIDDPVNRFVADVETPVISGHAHAEAFNTIAKIYVDRATEQFALSAAEANFNIPSSYSDDQHRLIAKAVTETIADTFVSVVFNREYAMLAAAHPFHMTETLVYDLEHKKIIELPDIFTDVGKSLDYISSKSVEQVLASLASYDAQDSFIKKGVEATESNYRTFTVDENGVTFYFAEYQVAPYAAGPQQSTVSWAELRPLLTTQFKSFVK
jgi:Protein of unknown function (DUF3298)